MPKKMKHEFKAEMRQLLHLIIHSLYTNPEVFLRELISNSSDALNKVSFKKVTGEAVQSPKLDLTIKITVDEKKNRFTIEDTGIGMTEEDLNERLGTIASSGTLQFIQDLQKNKGKLDGNMIGQFGVGFYSAFMVTDEIKLETRHADPNGEGWRWISDGKGTYETERIDRTVRGTKISFQVKEEHKEFCNEYTVKQLIKKYSNFVDYPIEVNGEVVNSTGAIWHKSKSSVTDEERKEFYQFITNDTEEPLGHLHLDLEGRINFKALLFIPKKAKKDFYRNAEFSSLHLYSNRVFVQDDCKDLLPEYLRFVEGVVDSVDLPLNVSREVTQHSPVMTKIREVLVNKILSLIESWAKKKPELFHAFYDEFGPLFKSGLNSDFANRDRLIELLRFHSTWESGVDFGVDASKESGVASGKESGKESGKGSGKESGASKDWVSLATYKERMQEGQKEIYYLSGESLTELEKDPKLEFFRKKGIEVLLLDDPVDAFIIPAVGNYKDLGLKSIESANLDLPEETETDSEKLSESDLKDLIRVFTDQGGDQLEKVVLSKRLVDAAVTLTVGESGMDTQMERMMRMMDPSMEHLNKRVLEINPSHPLIKNLHAKLASGNKELVERMAKQLYEGALLLQGDLSSPGGFVKRMTAIMEQATS